MRWRNLQSLRLENAIQENQPNAFRERRVGIRKNGNSGFADQPAAFNMIKRKTILEYIKFISRRNLIFPVVVIAVMAVLLAVIPFGRVLNPPVASSVDEILEYADSGYTYLSIEISGYSYSGYDYYSESGEVKAGYYYILDEENAENLCMFLLIPWDEGEISDEQTVYKAKVKLLRNDKYFESFLTGFSTDIGWSSSALRAAGGDVLISSYDYNPALYIILLILIIAVMAICLVYGVINLLTYLFPTLHEAARRLKKFGLDEDDFREIDDEMAHNRILSAGNLYITDHYFVAYSNSGIAIVPLYNIVWAYKYSSWNRLRRFSKLNYSLVIVTSPRDRITIKGNKKRDADAILRFFRRDFTHITVGYSEEIRNEMEGKI